MSLRPSTHDSSATHHGSESSAARPTIGWREWIALPELGIPLIKAKIDTGARSSALHAYDVTPFHKRGGLWVRFKVHPVQRNATLEVESAARVHDRRYVRTSSGARQLRWVIETDFEIMGLRWPMELTLSTRDQMGFRMLLGRQAVRRRALIDPGGSFLAGRWKRRAVLNRFASIARRHNG